MLTYEEASDKIIIALDCSKERAFELADLLAGKATWVKVGMTLFYAEGPAIVDAMRERGLRVFLDLKVHDIPFQVQGAVRAASLTGADILSIHGLGSSAMIAAARKGAEEAAEQPHAPHADASDDAFEEVDLASREGRLVMGRSGLVELERPAAPVRRPAVVQNGPFTEITVGGEPAPESAPEASGEAGAARQDSSARHAAPEPAAVPSSPFVEIALTPAASQHEAETAAPHYGEEAPAAPQYEAETPAAPAAPLHAAAEPVESLHAAAAEPGIVVTVEANKAREVDDAQIATDAYDPLKDLVNYHRPPVSLLEDYMSDTEVSDEEIYENKSKIEETLKNFGIPIQRIKATVGPTVTLYEIVQAQGVKISKIQGLENDIAQSLKALGIRIIAPIPGKGTIGIEVPNRDKQVVSMYSAIRSLRFQESKAELPVVIGRTIQNENYVFDLTKMPHLLVAGATGHSSS